MRRGARSRDYGRGRGRQINPADITAVPKPPEYSPKNPLAFPFQSLCSYNSQRITYDEELLRAIISLYSVKSISHMPLSALLSEMRNECPVAIRALNDESDYFMAYLQHYPEHFQWNCDPNFPNDVWYLSSCKIVAKSDRRRYKREYEAGNIKAPIIEEVRAGTFNADIEQKALAYFLAVFEQRKQMLGVDYSAPLNVRVFAALLTHGVVPPEVLRYIGHAIERFVACRPHIFSSFGHLISLRSPAYRDGLRRVALYLKMHGDSYDLAALYKLLKNTAYLGEEHKEALPDMLASDQQLGLFLHQHKLLFNVDIRMSMIHLRNVPPVILDSTVAAVNPFPDLLNNLQSSEETMSTAAAKSKEPNNALPMDPNDDEAESGGDSEDDDQDDDDGDMDEHDELFALGNGLSMQKAQKATKTAAATGDELTAQKFPSTSTVPVSASIPPPASIPSSVSAVLNHVRGPPGIALEETPLPPVLRIQNYMVTRQKFNPTNVDLTPQQPIPADVPVAAAARVDPPLDGIQTDANIGASNAAPVLRGRPGLRNISGRGGFRTRGPRASVGAMRGTSTISRRIAAASVANQLNDMDFDNMASASPDVDINVELAKFEEELEW